MSTRTTVTSVVWVALLLGAFASLRLRVADLPLERDEGEYAYAGQSILRGEAPYSSVYSMKWPGTYAAYALILATLGESVRAIRLGMLLVTSVTAVGVGYIAWRALGSVPGALVALATQLFLSFSISSLGPFGHATHFVALFGVAGFAVLIDHGSCHGTSSLSLLIAGALLASAALMKQPGMFFGAAAVVVLLPSWKKVALLAAGALPILGGVALSLAAAGVFRRFWFWTIAYAREYASIVTVSEGWAGFKFTFGQIVKAAPALWLIAATGLVFVRSRVVLCLLAAGAIATTPGFFFRQHYFLVLFPAVALLVGTAVDGAILRMRQRSRAIPIAIFSIAFAAAVIGEVRWVTRMQRERTTREIYGTNPFIESEAIGRYIRARTSGHDRIAVLGSEPEIYFYSGRRSATGFMYTYPLMEPQPFARVMQQEMMEEIARARPAYIVAVENWMSWLQRPDSDPSIIKWMRALPHNGYIVDGVVEIYPDHSEYHWGTTAAAAQLRSNTFLVVLRRR